MSLPVTFQRIYRDTGQDIEHPASPEAVMAVLTAMKAAGGLNPFKVRLRFADGSAVTVSPMKTKQGAKA